MKKTATGLLLLVFAVFTLRTGVERTQTALQYWSSHSNSHSPVFQSPNSSPKFPRIAGNEFVQEELGYAENSVFIAADEPVVPAERLHEPAIDNSLPRPPPLSAQIA